MPKLVALAMVKLYVRTYVHP